jgi:beta-fructofuranosidase
MVIDDEGVPTAPYTGNVAGHRETYGMLARSTDGFRTWQKKMVMHNDQRPNARSPVHWDAQIWKEGDSWCQLIGGTTGGKRPRGAAFLWTSPDLERWELVKPIHTGGPGRYWELPYLVPLGGKHVLMIGVGGNPYCIGSYDKATMTFTPDGPNNPHMVDDKGPEGSARRIMHGWVKTPPSRAKGVPYWQGAHSIPRVITVRDGRLIQEPVPEIQSLRGERRTFRGIALAAGANRILEGIEGDALEIVATFRGGGTGRFGLKVRASADGKTGVPAWFDTGKREFGAAEKRAASDLEAGRSVRMHVFVDRSVTEVYLNGNAVTKVAYLGSAPRAVAVFAEGGGCRLESIDVWRMKSMWE